VQYYHSVNSTATPLYTHNFVDCYIALVQPSLHAHSSLWTGKTTGWIPHLWM